MHMVFMGYFVTFSGVFYSLRDMLFAAVVRISCHTLLSLEEVILWR